MSFKFDRREMLLGTAAGLAAFAAPAWAQDKPKLRFSAVFSDQDIRAKTIQRFAEAVADQFTLEPFYGGTLFKQGTELVAPCSATTSRWGTSRRRTSRTRFPPGRS